MKIALVGYGKMGRAIEIAALARTQAAFIRHALPWLKPGGTLVYSTCSVDGEENEAVIRRTLADCPQLELVEEQSHLPFRDGTDGAYAACLRQR